LAFPKRAQVQIKINTSLEKLQILQPIPSHQFLQRRDYYGRLRSLMARLHGAAHERIRQIQRCPHIPSMRMSVFSEIGI
jgi:hypothetical protein